MYIVQLLSRMEITQLPFAVLQTGYVDMIAMQTKRSHNCY